MERIDIKEEINDWNNFIFARKKIEKEEELCSIIFRRNKHKRHLKRIEELHKQARR